MRKPVIGVFGGGSGTVPRDGPTHRLAVALGRCLAQSGALVLCGGRGGVMEAVAQGARAGGGRSIGILPFATASGERANEFIDHAVFTGLGDGRNFLMAAVPDAAIALAGEAGTLSEIGLALKLGTPLVYLGAWRFLNDHGLPAVPYTEAAEEAARLAFTALQLEPGQLLSRPLRRPTISDQAANLLRLEQVVRSWSGR
jgi:uncharacterized protein (TIGR00725 family)